LLPQAQSDAMQSSSDSEMLPQAQSDAQRER
jgi:hypothetical protein